MIVSGWVSSKSRRFAATALRKDAHKASSRSERPITVAVAAPLNGDKVRIAAVTTGSRAEPSVVAKKLRIDRRAWWACASTSAHDEAATKSASVVLTLGIWSCGTRGVFLVFPDLMPICGKLSTLNVMLDSLSDNHNNPARWRSEPLTATTAADGISRQDMINEQEKKPRPITGSRDRE
ncbi:hypothetical protein BRAS3843_1750083 [Bradyrhizobium sp. STM 3843]|nr:hypothetical protein BRAS3843_1750083 [Bradyrhizobium sp. STM 3843]